MTHPIVPINKLQETRRQQETRISMPGSGEFFFVPCQILKVYVNKTSTEVAAQDTEVPDHVKNTMKDFPGLLFAKVMRISDGTIYFLPFEKPYEELITNFGNEVQLPNYDAKIKFVNNDLLHGKIVLTPKAKQTIVDERVATKAFDIGAIFGY